MIPPRLLRSAFVMSMLFVFLSFGTAIAQPIRANQLSISAASTIAPSAMPLKFVSNAGQLDPSVQFEMHTHNKTLWFGLNEVVLNLSAVSDAAIMVSCANSNMQMTAASPIEIQSLLGLIFDGANPNPGLQGAASFLGMANLFTADNPLEWRSNEAVYGGIVYNDLYPGVDLSFSGQGGKLTATYTLAAGIDPSLIAWHYLNADSLYTNAASGDLHIYTADGGLLMSYAPVAWQIRSGNKSPVHISYENTSEIGVRLAASVTGYDPTLPLTVSFRMD